MTLKELRLPALLLAGFALAGPTPARAWETEKVSRTFPISADGTVSLDNVNGAVEVSAWANSTPSTAPSSPTTPAPPA